MAEVAAMGTADVTPTVIADSRVTVGSVIWAAAAAAAAAAATIGPDMTTVIVVRSRLPAWPATIVIEGLGGKMTGGEQHVATSEIDAINRAGARAEMIVRLVRWNPGSHERTTPIGTVPETATGAQTATAVTVAQIIVSLSDERTAAPMPMANTPNGSEIIEAISLAVGSMNELSIGPSRMAMPIEAEGQCREGQCRQQRASPRMQLLHQPKRRCLASLAVPGRLQPRSRGMHRG